MGSAGGEESVDNFRQAQYVSRETQNHLGAVLLWHARHKEYGMIRGFS